MSGCLTVGITGLRRRFLRKVNRDLCYGMKMIQLIALFVLSAGFAYCQDEPQQRPDMEAKLKAFFAKFPESDLNKDGKLTREEVPRFLTRNIVKKVPIANAQSAQRRRTRTWHMASNTKQRFDLWPVEGAEKPTPLAIYIHGGGFRGGDKRGVSAGAIAQYRKQGIAFASLNYRLSDVGPYPMMMHDAARAVQTIRHRAKEWNLDPTRIACYGGSAGAGISLWLAFHDDLADPESEDPIARESTRILAAGTSNGQSTYDLRTFREWFGVPDLKPHEALIPFYAIKSPEDWESDRVKQLMTDASPISASFRR